MSVNTLTGYLLVCIEKPKEALEFIEIAEKICHKLIQTAYGTTKADQTGNNINNDHMNIHDKSALDVVGEKSIS